MAQRAGGLYGGIKFSSNLALPSDQAQPTSSIQAPSTTPIAAAPKTLPQSVVKARETTVTKTASAPQENAEASPEVAPKASAGWSAALAFAPVRRQNKPKPPAKTLPPGATMVASLAMAAAATVAGPSVPTATDQSIQEGESAGWGKKIKAPSMVLDDDVNGFRAARPGEGKRKKKKNINANQIIWDPMEPYDPFFPNDYHEYKNFKQRQREERRMQERRRVEDLKRRREDNRSDYTSDSYSDEGRPSRKTARYHSPEPDEDDWDSTHGLGMSAPAFQIPGQEPMEKDDEPMDLAPPAPIAQDETGEEAYLRRVRMSQRALRPSSPPAPAPAPVPVPTPPSFLASPVPSFPMSSLPVTPIQPPPLPPPSQIVPPPQFKVSGYSSDRMDDEELPGLEEQPSLAPPPQVSTTLSQATIEERKKAAAAIAARLSALSKISTPAGAAPLPPLPPASQSPAPTQRDPAGFAARMMAKFGYVEGQGLGANADGIVEPIMLERNLGPKGGKKGEGGETGKKSSVGGMGMGGVRMGRIVNSQAEEKNRADIARYGESSRIILLTNIVSLEDVDDDLQGEIGDECSKHGTVERVLVHMPYPTPVDSGEAVRIFVQFAGPAAAWKAVRDLDGRFFGGRTVRARYYEEGNFARRLLDLPV
ncbi:hypothetical protein FRB91_009168 [Serendipita sp. 411]|nr:hypothetical protein FRB91_009168 [Serendipita sp. 411]